MDSIIICILKTSKSMLPVQISPLRSQLFYLTTLSFPLAISQKHLKLILDLPSKLDYPICLLPMKKPPNTQYKSKKCGHCFISFFFPYHLHPLTSAPFPFILSHPVPILTATISMWTFPFPFWRNDYSLPPLVWRPSHPTQQQ